MRKILFAVVAVFLFWSLAYPQQNPKVEPLSISDLKSRPVIGDLGVPLGKVVEIEATIIGGNQFNTKGTHDRFLLQVNKVNGDELKANPIMDFGSRFGVDLPSDIWSLAELKTGKKVGEVTRKEAEQLEKAYVGKKVKLVAYETGSFSGIPKLPKGIESWQDHGFGFSNSLAILAKHK